MRLLCLDGGFSKVGSGKETEMGNEKWHEVTVHIRWMIRRDMLEVLKIETHSFEFPWTEEDFVNCLRQRNCIGMVAEHDDQVVGFMIYELHQERLHVLNFAVAKDFQRCNVGTTMVQKLVSKLSPQRRSRIMLEVRESNLPAQLFFRNMDFRAVSVLHNFYEDTVEDAYLMEYRQHADMPASLAVTNRITRLAG